MLRIKPVDWSGGAGARIVRVLRCVAEGPREFSLRALATRMQAPPSTVHRLLQLLVKMQMIERAEADAYRPGQELYRMASLLVQRFDIKTVAHPVLLELWTEWQETCSICAYSPADRGVKLVDSIASPHPVRYVIDPSTILSLIWGSLGRSILAFLPDADIEEVLAAAKRGPLSGSQPPPRAALRRELELIKRRGYAIYEDRTILDIAGIAAPIVGPVGQVMGCIGITMPAARFKLRNRPHLGAAARRAASRVSSALGAPDQMLMSRDTVSSGARRAAQAWR